MSRLFFENSAEIQRIFVPYKTANLLDGESGVFEQVFCLVDADGGDVLQGRHAHITFKTADKPAHAHVLVFRILINADFLRECFVEIADGILHLLLVHPAVCG